MSSPPLCGPEARELRLEGARIIPDTGGSYSVSGAYTIPDFTSVLLVKINNYKKLPSALFLAEIPSHPEFLGSCRRYFYPAQQASVLGKATDHFRG